MTEKVKLTREQARAIGLRIHKESAIRHHVEDTWVGEENRCLNELTLDEFVRALYIGYEVEEKYKVGDWIVKNSGKPFAEHEIAVQITKVDRTFVDFQPDRSVGIENIRHATPEEIKAEQERRVWKSIGREVGEFRLGDVYSTDGHRFYSFDVPERLKTIYELYNDEYIKGFYPAESFISFEDGDEV